MRPGDLIFVRGKGFFSWAIRQVTGGHYNHVEIFIGSGESVGAMEGKGVRLTNPWIEFKDEDIAICRVVAATDEQAWRVAQAAQAMLGARYDSRAILGVWFRFLGRRLGILFEGGNITNDDGAFFCCELIEVKYAAEGIRLVPGIDPSFVSPKEQFESPQVVLLEEKRPRDGRWEI